MPESTQKKRSRKAASWSPGKPYDGFPLTPHASGAWQKKVGGRTCYFLRWGRVVNGKLERLPGDDWWKPALEEYNEYEKHREKEEREVLISRLLSGRKPDDVLTVKHLCNRFLTAKTRKVDAGELSPRSLLEYRQTTDRIVAAFGEDRFGDDRLVEGLVAFDFETLRAEIAKQYGPVRLGNEITRVKSVFKYAFDNGLIDRPARYGSEFKKPGKAVLRKHRAAQGKRLFEAEEIRTLLDAASPPLRAMILLGVNCGFGNSDCAELPTRAVDLKRGWVDFPRPKTGIERRCPLWPETVEAIRVAQEDRPTPKVEADAECVFLTSRGIRWVRTTTASRTDGVTVGFAKLLRRLKINGRKGLGFYTLRHVHRTISDGAQDQVAANLIMGHADDSMAAIYREHIDDARLVEVTDRVRTWLFGDEGDE